MLIRQEKVDFQESGGFDADKKTLKSIAESYPDSFKRKGVHDFTRFLLKYDFESKPLPPEKGWGKVVAMVAAAASALILSAAYLLPLAWYTVYRCCVCWL